MREVDDPRACKAHRDDYLECLHHRKEARGWRGKDEAARPGPPPAHPQPPSFSLQFTRLNSIYREQKKQAAAAAGGGEGEAKGGH